jgi:hypothetical protein
MKTLLSFVPVLFLTACMSVLATGDVTAHATLQFDKTAPANLAHILCEQNLVLSTTAHDSFDISNVLQELQKQGSLQVTFTESSLLPTQGSLSAFKYAELYIANDKEQPELLAKTNFSQNANGKVDVPIVMDSGRLFQVLSQGKVNITSTLESCLPAEPIVAQYTLASDMQFKANKSL